LVSLQLHCFQKYLAKRLHSAFHEWIEEELVGATFYSSTTTVEAVLGITNGFWYGAAPKPPL